MIAVYLRALALLVVGTPLVAIGGYALATAIERGLGVNRRHT